MAPDVTALIIVVMCVILFVVNKLPMCVVGVLGCLLMVLTKAASFQTIFSSFSNEIVVLMVSAMVVGIAMKQVGLSQYIGRIIIRWSKNRESVFLFVACLISGLLSMFMSNTALLAMFLPIIDSVCKVSGTMKRRNLVLPVTCAIMLGGASTLIGCTPQLTADGLLSTLAGMTMSMWTLTGPGLSLFAIYLIYIMTIGRRINDRIWGDREEKEIYRDASVSESVYNAKVDSKKLIILCIILLLMILSYIFSFLPTAETALCAALLCIITGCCSVESAVKEMPWESVIFLASCLGLGNALTEAGSTQLLVGFISGLTGLSASPLFFFAFFVLFTLVISQFVTNSVAIIITLPIALTVCNTFGFSILTFCIGITMAASVACLTPLAASQITMTQVAGYKFRDYFFAGIVPSVLFCAVIILFVPMFYPLTV